jgi:hypothetical protein
MKKQIRSFIMAALPMVLVITPSFAENDSDINDLQELVKKQETLLKRQQAQLQAQQDELGEVKRRLNTISSSPASRKASGKKATAKVTSHSDNYADNKSTAKPIPQEVGTDRKEVAKEKIPEITVLDNSTGVLLQKGKFILEPSAEYSNSSATRVFIQGFTIIPALNIGAFEISEVNRDTLTARMTGRLGLTNRLEVDASVPYLKRSDSTTLRPFGVGSAADTMTHITGHDIGDIEFGAHYQINSGRDNMPVFIANGRFKTTTGRGPFDVPTDPVTGIQTKLPTGSGFYGFEPSVTAIYPTDPAVFFASFGYLMNFEKNIGGDIGKIDPGDVFDASAGLSIALNDKTSMSFSYSHNTVLKTKQNGNNIPNSDILQVGSLNIGTSYKLYDNTSINFIASIGVTKEAPDIRLLFKVPVSFTLF